MSGVAKKVESKSGALRVTAPLVVARTKAGVDRQMYRGDVVGDDVAKESVDHLRDLGFVSDK